MAVHVALAVEIAGYIPEATHDSGSEVLDGVFSPHLYDVTDCPTFSSQCC